MPFMAPVVAWVGANALTVATAVATAASGLMSYGASRTAAAQQQIAAGANAQQLELQAGQTRAISQLEAARKRRDNKAMLSDQRTVMAASGLTPDANIIGETVAEQTLQEMLTLAQGEAEAKRLEFAAQQTRLQGKYDASATRNAGVATLIGSAVSWGDRYGSTFKNKTNNVTAG